MTLREYLKQRGETPDAFAERLKRNRWGVRKWVYGQRRPSLEDIALIAAATGDSVQMSDFLAVPAEAVAS